MTKTFSRDLSRWALGALMALALGSNAAPLAAAGALEQSRAAVERTNAQLGESQQSIDALHDQTSELVDRYRSALSESETYEVYNRQLAEIVGSQETELASLQVQIDGIESTSRQVMPLMARMIDALAAFVAQDLPFLPHERAGRIEGLRDNMARADLSLAEKYRKILEAYQIEIDYGNSLEAYTDEFDGVTRRVLRVGRVALLAQSLDGRDILAWNKHRGAWQAVEDAAVRRSMALGLKMAAKQQSPELLVVPVSAVEAE